MKNYKSGGIDKSELYKPMVHISSTSDGKIYFQVSTWVEAGCEEAFVKACKRAWWEYYNRTYYAEGRGIFTIDIKEAQKISNPPIENKYVLVGFSYKDEPEVGPSEGYRTDFPFKKPEKTRGFTIRVIPPASYNGGINSDVKKKAVVTYSFAEVDHDVVGDPTQKQNV
ncbi:MAG: hypothetical protein MRZ79_08260 [Bacteroidia bacterium]|nr:hypothetical protein [Bacteroidia bacterium]